MTTANILCFLCGSLTATLIFFVIFRCQSRLDERLIRHIRSCSYRHGYEAGQESVIGKK
jgi:hypothetical protein